MLGSEPQTGGRSILRMTTVALAGGGPSYPAFVQRDRPPSRNGHVRPYFTRRTVNRILRDIIAVERDVAVDLPSEPGPSTIARWSGDRLSIDVSGYVPNRPVRRRSLGPLYDGLYALFDRRDWIEVIPRWPRRPPAAAGLLRLLAVPTPDRRPLLHRIRQDVPSDVLIDALGSGNDDAREVLVRVVGERTEPEARRAVAALLRDPSPGVRAEAAHTFEHFPDPRFGDLLLAAAMAEAEPDVLELQIRAVGASGSVRAVGWLDAVRTDDGCDARIRDAAVAAISAIRDGV